MNNRIFTVESSLYKDNVAIMGKDIFLLRELSNNMQLGQALHVQLRARR